MKVHVSRASENTIRTLMRIESEAAPKNRPRIDASLRARPRLPRRDCSVIGEGSWVVTAIALQAGGSKGRGRGRAGQPGPSGGD